MEETGKKIAAIVLAAGQGKRMHSEVAKQFLMLKGKPLVCYSLAIFEQSAAETVVLVTGKEEIPYCRDEIVRAYGFQKVADITAGGKERYHSVYQGLLSLKRMGFPEAGVVLIQDGARPLLDNGILERTIEGALRYGACVAAMPVKDTIKIADPDGFAASTPERSLLWQIQTPQAFTFGLILEAYRRLFLREEYQKGITDDAMVVENMTGHRVRLVHGSYFNMKVTTPEDMAIAAALMELKESRQPAAAKGTEQLQKAALQKVWKK